MTTTNPSTDWDDAFHEVLLTLDYPKIKHFVETLLSQREEAVRKEVVEFIREQMPVICYSYSTEEMETLFEAATNPTH